MSFVMCASPALDYKLLSINAIYDKRLRKDMHLFVFLSLIVNDIKLLFCWVNHKSVRLQGFLRGFYGFFQPGCVIAIRSGYIVNIIAALLTL